MQPRTISILGVPIENLDSVETEEKILHLIDQYLKKRPPGNVVVSDSLPPYHISTMNIDFLANTYGLGWRRVHDPELLEIFRKSSLVTAEGWPVIWLSKCLGNPLKERISDADLIPLLAEMLGEEKRSIYLLGDKEKTVHKAAKLLHQLNPGLKIAGIACPPIHIEGERLVESPQRDALLLEEIHKAAPDVLLVSLGHPKQEIWFERVRNKLRVPVAIGIGGTLDFLTKKASSSQRWSSQIYNALAFVSLSVPLILFHRLNEIIGRLLKGKNTTKVRRSQLFLSPYHSIAIVRLPIILCSRNVRVVNQYIDEAFAQDSLVLDFHKTRHLDLEGLGLLINSWKKARKEGKKILAFGLKANVRVLLRMHRVWDYISDSICSSPRGVVSRLTHNDSKSYLYEAIQQSYGTLTLSLFGKLDTAQNFDHYLQKLLPMIHRKNCIVDFTYCEFIDNAGFCFLLQLKQRVRGDGKKFKVKGLSRSLKRQFRLAQVEKLLTC